MHSLLDSELSKNPEFRSLYYTETPNYLNRFRKEIFACLDDGELSIDNNLAKRTIRNLTLLNATIYSILAVIPLLR